MAKVRKRAGEFAPLSSSAEPVRNSSYSTTLRPWTLADLRIPPSNHLEALKGNRKGQHSIRINQQYRICFRWTEAGVHDAEIVDYHTE